MASNILVVDDNESMRVLMRRILEEADLDLRVREATDGAEALPIALSGEIDIVLSDIVMPNIDGIQLLRSIRQHHDTNSLPVILLTSQADHETRVLSFEAGASDYLYKPFSSPELISRIQVQLRLKAMQEELRTANDRFRRLGTHDELTGLSNRRHLLDQCRRELARSRRHKFAMTLCALDIDAFRQVNSRLGNLVGDAVIAEASAVLERTLRLPDILSRNTGGRFTALLPQTDARQARQVCERLRASVQEHTFPGHEPGAVTISIGCATYPQGRLESVDELINAAESSLDRAKGGGGNRAEAWDNASSEP